MPKIVQMYILFFASICNKEGPMLIVAFVAFVLPLLEEERRPYYPLYYGL